MKWILCGILHEWRNVINVLKGASVTASCVMKYMKEIIRYLLKLNLRVQSAFSDMEVWYDFTGSLDSASRQDGSHNTRILARLEMGRIFNCICNFMSVLNKLCLHQQLSSLHLHILPRNWRTCTGWIQRCPGNLLLAKSRILENFLFVTDREVWWTFYLRQSHMPWRLLDPVSTIVYNVWHYQLMDYCILIWIMIRTSTA